MEDFSDEDLKSLKKLALFYPNNQYTPSQVMDLGYEEFLSQYLEGFCNLETLYVTSWPDQQRMADRTDLALVKLRDVAFQNHVSGGEHNPEQEAKVADECDNLYEMLRVDNERLHHFRKEWSSRTS